MLTGVVSNLSTSIDLGAAYTLLSPNLIVTAPDSSVTTSVPTVSPAIGTSANPHTFSSLFVPTMGGLHTGTWQFQIQVEQEVVSGSVVVNVPIQFWVCWTDIFDDVRTILGVDSTTYTNNRLSLEFFSLFTELYMYSGNRLPQYKDFSETYKLYFDLAMKYFLASRLRPMVPGKASSGELSLFKKGTTTAQFTNSQPKQDQTIEQQLWLQGYNIVQAQIPEIAIVFNIDRNEDEVMTRGELAEGNWFGRKNSLQAAYGRYGIGNFDEYGL